MMLSIYTAGKVMPHGDRTLVLICCLTLVVVSLQHFGPLSKPFSCSCQISNKIKLDCIITVCVYVNLRIDIFLRIHSQFYLHTSMLFSFLVDVLNTCSKKDLHFVLSSNNGLLIHIHCTSILISNFMKDDNNDNNDNFLNLLFS